MTTLPELSSIVASAAEQKDMRPRSDLGEPGWTFWERRTCNAHEGMPTFSFLPVPQRWQLVLHVRALPSHIS